MALSTKKETCLLIRDSGEALLTTSSESDHRNRFMDLFLVTDLFVGVFAKEAITYRIWLGMG
jgi:hypothetical protein